MSPVYFEELDVKVVQTLHDVSLFELDYCRYECLKRVEAFEGGDLPVSVLVHQVWGELAGRR